MSLKRFLDCFKQRLHLASVTRCDQTPSSLEVEPKFGTPILAVTWKTERLSTKLLGVRLQLLGCHLKQYDAQPRLLGVQLPCLGCHVKNSTIHNQVAGVRLPLFCVPEKQNVQSL